MKRPGLEERVDAEDTEDTQSLQEHNARQRVTFLHAKCKK